jgi:hypothetical protein
MVLGPREVRCQLAITLPAMLPSDHEDGVGTSIAMISRLYSPACTFPCQRFATALTDGNA